MRISQMSTSSPFWKNPSMQILSIIWSLDHYPLNGQSRTSIASLSKFGTSFRKNHFSSSTVLTRSFGDVYQKRNKEVCSISAMSLHAENTSVLVKPQRKSYKVGFTGPFSSKTPSFFTSHMKLSKNWEDFEERHDALKPNSRSRNFWCLGHRLRGIIPKFIWQSVHF